MFQSPKIVLPDASLCAIVRDEKMNPAGGIERFVHAHVPHVEEAVIVDTSSVDGTREILEELSAQYDNLRVMDHLFVGYAQARNFSLDKARTKYVLVLDADELLTSKKPTNDWKVLLRLLKKRKRGKNSPNILTFDFDHILPNGSHIPAPQHIKRFFVNSKKLRFENNDGFAWEELHGESCEYDDSDVKIKHFLPSEEARELKKKQWYGRWEDFRSPSSVESFEQWKAYNPKRDSYF
ncbi:glycosyltransferase [Candidatus Pacearchaeota archaeon]|nr:glycosyltransferase [Candidatus Pacearchaeota archaeon]